MLKKIHDITLIKKLGEGAFGTVYLSTKDGKPGYFATKQLDRKTADKPSFYKYFENELRLLYDLKHPNIVKLESLEKDNKYYYIVMEYVNGGNLKDCLKKFKSKYGRSFPEEYVQYLMRQIVDTIKFIHQRNIIHRDLKLENIMVNFDNEIDRTNCNMMKAQIKLIDFGCSIRLSYDKKLAKTLVGSPITMDPLILNELAKRGKKVSQLGYDQKADIWSLGTICYELLIGKAVFDAKTMDDLIQKVESGSYTIPTSISREVVAFLNGMLQYEGKNRLTAAELSIQPFLTKHVKDFNKIDTTKIQKKIDNKGLNINVKKNKTIWSIFNENDEQKLIGINPHNISAPPPPYQPQKPIPKPQNQQDIYKKRNTEQITPKIKFNDNNNKNYKKSLSNNNNNHFVQVKNIYDKPKPLNQQQFFGQDPNMNNINQMNMMNNMNYINNMNYVNNMNMINMVNNINKMNMINMMNNINQMNMMNNVNNMYNINQMNNMNNIKQNEMNPNSKFQGGTGCDIHIFGMPTFTPAPSTFNRNMFQQNLHNVININNKVGNVETNININNNMGGKQTNFINITNETSDGNQTQVITINNSINFDEGCSPQ